MLHLGTMNDVNLHFGQPEAPSGQFAASICEVQYPLQCIMIHSKCKSGTSKVRVE